MTRFLQASAVAILALYGYAAFGAETEQEKAPSANAVCGYQWREAKKADPTLKGRDAWIEFRRTKCAGVSKTRNDDAIRRYLEKQKTETETAPTEDEGETVMLAKFKKKGK